LRDLHALRRTQALATRLHKTRHFFVIAKIMSHIAWIDRSFSARDGCGARQSGRGQGGKKITPGC